MSESNKPQGLQVQFETQVTEQDLMNFKLYHNYHSVGGVAGLLFGIVALIICVVSVGQVNISYTLMMGYLGLFITVYTPNSQSELARLDYRMTWEDAFLAYLKKLEETKPVIFCGDLNVAHKEIDLKNPKTNRKNAGFTDEERQKFTELLNAGFVDTFRYFYPEQTGIYSWWSYRFSARAKNAGWRIDYFCVSESLKDRLEDAKILTDIMGSDHCPVELDIK